jgi:RNA polymerase sigma-70 factor (ECF subfamily)
MRRQVHGSQRGVGGEKADADLIAEMHLPNSDALGALFRRYIRLVHSVAVDILRDEGEAEDVTQEVFLEIYRKSHLYDPSRGAVRVWLLQYAYRRSLRRRDLLRRRAAYAGEPLDGAEPPIRGHRQHLTRDECRWVIRTGLAQLPERQRATLELACLEEKSLREVAQRLRVSLGCARHYYYRGLARLRAWARVGVLSPDAPTAHASAPVTADRLLPPQVKEAAPRTQEFSVPERVRAKRASRRRVARDRHGV